MKKINIYLSVSLVACFSLVSCDKGFNELNVNPVALTAVDPGFQLNTAIINSVPGYGNLSYETTIVKQMITPFSGQGSAANFNQDNRSVAAGNWNTFYQSVIKELTDVVAKTKADPTRANLYNTTRIWRAYSFMILTDTYGDIPYDPVAHAAVCQLRYKHRHCRRGHYDVCSGYSTRRRERTGAD